MRIHVASDAVRPMLDDPDDLASWMEPGSGLIRVIGQGQWTTSQVDLHFAALSGLIAERRRSGGAVLVLVDLRDSLVQQPEIVEQIGRAVTRIYDSSDRVAVVVASSLLKLQLKRVANVASIEFFVSMNAARTWLTAYQ